MNKLIERFIHGVSFSIGIGILLLLGKSVLMVWKEIVIFVSAAMVLGLLVSAGAYVKEKVGGK